MSKMCHKNQDDLGLRWCHGIITPLHEDFLIELRRGMDLGIDSGPRNKPNSIVHWYSH